MHKCISEGICFQVLLVCLQCVQTFVDVRVLFSLCVFLGTIFLNAGKVTVLSPVLGETVTVDASVCPHEINKFHFIWHQDSVKLPYENHLSYTIRASKSSFCMCIAVNLSSGKELYSSEVFSVEPTGYPSSSELHHLICQYTHKHVLHICTHTHVRAHTYMEHTHPPALSHVHESNAHIPCYACSHKICACILV